MAGEKKRLKKLVAAVEATMGDSAKVRKLRRAAALERFIDKLRDKLEALQGELDSGGAKGKRAREKSRQVDILQTPRSSSCRADQSLDAANANIAHPAISRVPPIGVIAPSQRAPVAHSTYRLPEKINVPAVIDQPARPSHALASGARIASIPTTSSATACTSWYFAAVSHVDTRPDCSRVALSACAPKAPRATPRPPRIAPISTKGWLIPNVL